MDEQSQSPVAKCAGHPGSHLRCYQSRGTGEYHICIGRVHGERNLEECLRRYNEATARGVVTDDGYHSWPLDV